MSSLKQLSLSPFSLPSPTLAHLNRMLSTTSGQDKPFMLISYSAHIIAYLLRHPRAFPTKAKADVADRIQKLGAAIGDARVLYRLFGLLPIIQWAQSLNDSATAPKDKQIRILEKLQAWSMILYYPLEHWYYLASKGVFKLTPKKSNFVAMWSCRFWAAYVFLQFLHIRRNQQLLAASVKAPTSDPATPPSEDARQFRTKAAALRRDFLVQLGYLPLTMHWSLENGLLPSQVWVGACGTLSAAVGLVGAWKASA